MHLVEDRIVERQDVVDSDEQLAESQGIRIGLSEEQNVAFGYWSRFHMILSLKIRIFFCIKTVMLLFVCLLFYVKPLKVVIALSHQWEVIWRIIFQLTFSIRWSVMTIVLIGNLMSVHCIVPFKPSEFVMYRVGKDIIISRK